MNIARLQGSVLCRPYRERNRRKVKKLFNIYISYLTAVNIQTFKHSLKLPFDTVCLSLP